MDFCLGTEGFKSSQLRNGWFQCFFVKELKVPMFLCIGAEGSKGSLHRYNKGSNLTRHRAFLGPIIYVYVASSPKIISKTYHPI